MNLRVALLLVGAVLLVFGTAVIYLPAGFLMAGVLVIAVAALSED